MLLPVLVAAVATLAQQPADPWLHIPAGHGPAAGKRVVLVSGDEEYRSEEVLPQLARLLARLGFDCTVLFAIDPVDGTINPNHTRNIPGLAKLADADLMIISTRMRTLPDDQMRCFADYLASGKPVIGMRTATHAFKIDAGPYAGYSWDCKEPGHEGGFGRQVLGETWINHHGIHGKQGTRGVVAPGQEAHPILRGVGAGAIFCTTDVYEVRLPLPGDSLPLVLGQVTETLDPASGPAGTGNSPMMPVAWTRTYAAGGGKRGRVFTTTMGASQDLLSEGVRRLLVNASLWAVGLERKITPSLDVTTVGDYRPTPFRFKQDAEWKPGIRPSDLGR